MNNLRFIKETIYFLKRDYGTPILLGSILSNFNVKSGKANNTIITLFIGRAILLPTSQVTQYLRTLGFGKAGEIENLDRIILVDKRDIPSTFDLGISNFIGYNSNGLNSTFSNSIDWDDIVNYNKTNNTTYNRTEVVKIQDSMYAMAISVKEINGIAI